MPIHLIRYTSNTELLCVQLHLFSVLCKLRLESANANKIRIRRNILNLRRTRLGSFDALGSIFVSIFIVCRAFGGRTERNNRAVLALGEKGLKTVETSVMNLVIIFATGA